MNELYNDIILDYADAPDFRGDAPNAQYQAAAYNPNCGDDISLSAMIDQAGSFTELKWNFIEDSCTFSRAAASMLVESVGHNFAFYWR